MKDTQLRKIICGRTAKFNRMHGTIVTMYIAGKYNENETREIKFRYDDGLISYLINRIEKLEDSLYDLNCKLEEKKKND